MAAWCSPYCVSACSVLGQHCVAEGLAAGGVPKPCTCASARELVPVQPS